MLMLLFIMNIFYHDLVQYVYVIRVIITKHFWQVWKIVVNVFHLLHGMSPKEPLILQNKETSIQVHDKNINVWWILIIIHFYKCYHMLFKLPIIQISAQMLSVPELRSGKVFFVLFCLVFINFNYVICVKCIDLYF